MAASEKKQFWVVLFMPVAFNEHIKHSHLKKMKSSALIIIIICYTSVLDVVAFLERERSSAINATNIYWKNYAAFGCFDFDKLVHVCGNVARFKM